MNPTDEHDSTNIDGCWCSECLDIRLKRKRAWDKKRQAELGIVPFWQEAIMAVILLGLAWFWMQGMDAIMKVADTWNSFR